MNIEKTFKYNERDLINYGFNTYIYRRGWFLLAIVSVFALCLAALIYITGSLNQIEIIMIIIFVATLAASPIIIYFQMRSTYKTSKVFHDEQSFIFEGEGVTGRSSIGESKVEWDMFYKFAIYKDVIALYVSSRQAYIFPRRIFTDDEVNQLKNFLLSDEATKSKTKIYKQ